MITDPNGKWRVICPPKTGATTLHHLLSRPPIHGVVSTGANGREDFHASEPLYGGVVYVSVRNPLERAVSLWRHRRHELGDGEPVDDDSYPFRAFVSELPELTPFYNRTMLDYFRNIRVSREVIRMENFEADVRRLFPGVGEIPRLNASVRAKLSRDPYRDPGVERAVRGWFAEDFRWGYI